jgi:hypothetical protein
MIHKSENPSDKPGGKIWQENSAARRMRNDRRSKI